MSRICELTGKGGLTGNNVSHAKNRTKRRFLPNLQEATLTSEALGRSVRLRVSAAALRSVDHCGGLDSFLVKARDSALSSRALKVKREIAKTGTPEIAPEAQPEPQSDTQPDPQSDAQPEA